MNAQRIPVEIWLMLEDGYVFPRLDLNFGNEEPGTRMARVGRDLVVARFRPTGEVWTSIETATGDLYQWVREGARTDEVRIDRINELIQYITLLVATGGHWEIDWIRANSQTTVTTPQPKRVTVITPDDEERGLLKQALEGCGHSTLLHTCTRDVTSAGAALATWISEQGLTHPTPRPGRTPSGNNLEVLENRVKSV